MGRHFQFSIALLAVSVALTEPAIAQTPAEHAAHHPAPAAATPAPQTGMPMPAADDPAAGGTPAGAAPAGGMGAGMGGMMGPQPPAGDCVGGDCGKGAGATPIYPSLMTLPALTPEKRAEIAALGSQQISEGLAQLAAGSASLDRATQAGDDAAMQQAVGVMREGLGKLDAGIAARRVLSEGKAPRNLALDWFKREMSLASPVVRDDPGAHLGLTPFHFITMAILIAFALAMLAMYFFKMRRAAALFGRIEPDKGSPPPGSAPPLA